MAFDPVRIEEKIDRTAATSIEVTSGIGGVRFQNMLEVMETAKMMSLSGPILPKWLQNNPGGCWAVIIQAIEWRMSPIQVGRMSYEVNGNVGYMGQLIHAVVEARAPLAKRLRFDFEGDGDLRLCVVTGLLRGESEPLVLRTPPVGRITPKNSPLWRSDVDQQLAYYGARTWARRFTPEVLLGIYAEDELPTIEATATEVKPDIGSRLPGAGKKAKDGFSADHVERTTKPKSEAQREAVTETDPASVKGDEPAASAKPASTDAGGAPPTSAQADRPPQSSPATDAPASGEGDSPANHPDQERLILDVAHQPGGGSENTTAAAQAAAIPPIAQDTKPTAEPASAEDKIGDLTREEGDVVRALHMQLAMVIDAVEINRTGDRAIKEHKAKPASPMFRAIDFVRNRHVERAKGRTESGVVDSTVERMLMRSTKQMDDLLGGGA